MPPYYFEQPFCHCVEYDQYAICYNNKYPSGIKHHYALTEECPWYDCMCLWHDPHLVYIKPYYYPECSAYSYCDIYTPAEYYGMLHHYPVDANDAVYYDDSAAVAAGVAAGTAVVAGAVVAGALLL